MRRDGRRTPLPASWLQLVTRADSAAVGEATTVEDLGADDDAGSRRPGYRVRAQIERRTAVFGDPPEHLDLEGATARPGPQRGQAPFPPDTLRQTPFWDDAVPGEHPDVLVLLGEDPTARRLHPDDWLPDDVARIRRWAGLGGDPQKKVLADLADAPAGPVALAAGFELLTRAGDDPSTLFEQLAQVPRSVEGALAGVVRQLRVAAPEWPDDMLVTVASTLVDHWAKEDDPATLAEYVTWFDAGSTRLAAAEAGLRARIVECAQRTAAAKVEGEAGPAWEQTLQQRAGTLLAGVEGEGRAG